MGQRYYKNSEGYPDVTAEMAMELVEIRRRKSPGKIKCEKTIKEIREVCKKNGFRLVNRVELEDVSNGRVWR